MIAVRRTGYVKLAAESPVAELSVLTAASEMMTGVSVPAFGSPVAESSVLTVVAVVSAVVE